MALPAQPVGRLMWAWPPGTTWRLSLLWPGLIVPAPSRPSAGASLPGGVGPRFPAAWVNRSHPRAMLSPTHPAPTSQTAPSSTHALLVRPESSKAWTQALQLPCPVPAHPQDMHSQVRTRVLQLPVHIPRSSLHTSPHSHTVLLLGSALINSLTLTPHLLRPQSAPASPQGLCIQPRVCGHCPGFPRSGATLPAPTLGTGSLQSQGLDLPGWPRAGWPFLLPFRLSGPLGLGRHFQKLQPGFGPGVDLKTCPELRLWFAGMNSQRA